MKLTYRGIKYEYAPLAVEVTAEEIGGKYRGAEWKRHHSQHIPITHHAAELKYRGATYYSGNSEEVEELKQRKKLNFIFATGNKLFVRNQANNQLIQTHRANLRRDLQRRLEVAKQKGDENLIRILEDEANQLLDNNY